MNEKEISFEEIMKQIENVILSLEKGELSLEDSMKAYENGVKNIQKAQEKLNKMEGKIEEILSDGTIAPFILEENKNDEN